MNIVTSVDGTTIAFDRLGSGPPVIVVGGQLCDRSLTRPTAEALAKHFSVFNYDRRGRGDSGDTPPYDPDREVEDLAAVIAAVGGSAAVYGHSSGAALGLRAAAAGVGVSALALFEPPYTAPDLASAGGDELGRRIEALVAAGRRGDAVEAFQLAIGMPRELVEGLREAPFRADLEAIAHTLPYDLAVIGPGTVPVDLLKQVDVPTVVVAGAASPPPLLAAARAVADGVPGAHLEVLDGVDHSAPPEVLAPPVARFLARGDR